MKKHFQILLAVITAVASMSVPAWSAESAESEATQAVADGTEASQADISVPAESASSQDSASLSANAAEDNIVTTKHIAVIQGNELSYTAQAGTMVLESGGSKCEIFFTAYTKDGVANPADRPITFAFNGGPGSASMYLHLGCLSPRRIDVDDKGNANNYPVQIVDNENSILDLTDVVIIDAVGTGFSRSLEATGEAFYGYDNDARTMGDFIRLYVSRNNRWGSKKYVAGESYGTTRAVGICEYLSSAYAMNLNGLILISSINDLSAIIPEKGNEIPYATCIPTFAADACYQGVLSDAYQKRELEDFLEEVRQFVKDEYVPALFQGSRYTDAEIDAVAEKYAAYTGLKKDFVLSSNLRVGLDSFLTELLKDQNLVVGRLDGRITGPLTEGSIDNGEADPSNQAFNLLFGDAFNNYVSGELGYQTDRPYIPSSQEVGSSWSFPLGGGWGGFLCQEQTIFECISKNPYLKIWVLCGYYDGATPFYAAEYTFSHVFLNDELKDNISFTYYESGHMIYMENESFGKFRKDAEAWYGL